MGARTAAACLLIVNAAAAQTPVVLPDRVVNAASFVPAGEPGHAVARGSLISIFGQTLAALSELAASIPLPFRLADVSVTIGGRPAPLLYVSETQINAQLPWDAVSVVPPGTNDHVLLVVNRSGLPGPSVNVPVAPFSPGIFALGGRLAVAVNAQDGTIAQPSGAVAEVATRPALPGSAIILYANGLGQVDRPVLSGNVASEAVVNTVVTPTVLIGGVEAQVLFSGLAPQFVGVNQVNVLVPANAPAGDAVPIQIQIGGITTSSSVTMAIGR